MTSGGVTAMLYRLDHWLDRVPHPNDRRKVVLHAKPEIVEEMGRDSCR